MTPREGGVSLLFDIWNFDCSCGCGGYIGAMCFGVFLNQFFAWLLVLGGSITLLNFLLICGTPKTTSFLSFKALHFGVRLWLLLQPIPNPTMLIFLVVMWFLAHVNVFLFVRGQAWHAPNLLSIRRSIILSLENVRSKLLVHCHCSF